MSSWCARRAARRCRRASGPIRSSTRAARTISSGPATMSRCRARSTASTWRARWRSSPTTCRWARAADQARQHIKLVMLVNDWSLRNLIPAELAKGFGFYQSKPATAFSPVAVTPDELGAAWDGGKVNLPLTIEINGSAVRQTERGRRHDVRFSATGRARHEDAQRARRHDRRLGHDLELRSSAAARPASPSAARWSRSSTASRSRRS